MAENQLFSQANYVVIFLRCLQATTFLHKSHIWSALKIFHIVQKLFKFFLKFLFLFFFNFKKNILKKF